jgi:hypothetical protein
MNFCFWSKASASSVDVHMKGLTHQVYHDWQQLQADGDEKNATGDPLSTCCNQTH